MHLLWSGPNSNETHAVKQTRQILKNGDVIVKREEIDQSYVTMAGNGEGLIDGVGFDSFDAGKRIRTMISTESKRKSTLVEMKTLTNIVHAASMRKAPCRYPMKSVSAM